MTNSQRLTTVRERFVQWLLDADDVQTAADPDQAAIRRESILIRDEFYCGRRFHTDLYDAVWFIEEDELKIFRADGSLACVLNSAEIDATSSELAADVESSETSSNQPHILKLPTVDEQRESDRGSAGDEIRRAA